jgi:hypothetical protein
MMRRAPLGFAALVVAGLVGMAPPVHGARTAKQGRVYVTVTGADGRPVKGLSAADFAVQENGTAKTVTSAESATAPLAVELLTDRLGGSYSPDQMRAALSGIADTILGVIPESRIGLLTFDGASNQQVPLTSSQSELDSAIKKLFSNNSPAVLLEGIADASRVLATVPEERRAIVAVVAEYRADLSSVQPRNTAEALRTSKAALWMLEAHSGAGSAPNANRDVMSTMATRDSGGTSMGVGAGTALAAAATRLAVLMLAQYVVTYEDPLPQKDVRLDVTVKRPNLRILAPHWTSGE